MSTSRQIHLKRYPKGIPTPDDFELSTVDLPELDKGEVLVKNLWMSVDPYMRGRLSDRDSYMESFQIGEPLDGGAIGQVIESRHSDLGVGTYVRNGLGWRDRFVYSGDRLRPLEAGPAELQAYLGALGMPGMTAYVGLLTIASIRAGDTVFVSAASGAVGSIACQIAKNLGCRVVGSAGSDKKVQWLRDDAGIDAAINYKTCSDLQTTVAESCPDGIDVYFENVGGQHLEVALNLMNEGGRVAFCGLISTYNDTDPTPGPSNLYQVIIKRLRLEGFIVTDYWDQYPTFLQEMDGWIKENKIAWRETVVEGIERAPEALINLFSGDNFGKMLVKLGEPEA